jgi:hypothetical protein
MPELRAADRSCSRNPGAPQPSSGAGDPTRNWDFDQPSEGRSDQGSRLDRGSPAAHSVASLHPRHATQPEIEHDLEKPAPDLIRGGNRFSEKIMLKQKVRLPTNASRTSFVQRATGALGLIDACVDAFGVACVGPCVGACGDAFGDAFAGRFVGAFAGLDN